MDILERTTIFRMTTIRRLSSLMTRASSLRPLLLRYSAHPPPALQQIHRTFHTSPSCQADSTSALNTFKPSQTALIFPGQGSQRCGSIVRDLESEWPSIVRPIWQEMDETLKKNLSKIMKDGLMSELSSTELAQPSILAHSYALYRVFTQTLGLKDASSLASVTLGHSLGEYTALVAAGSLTFADAIRLVHARGLAMKMATKQGEGGMVALLSGQGVPLHLPSILQLLQEAEAATESKIDLANLNSPFQFVVSGNVRALNYVKERVKNRDKPTSTANSSSSSSSTSSSTAASSSASPESSTKSLTRGISRAISLDVSGPFHSRLMQPAAAILKAELEKVTFTKPVIPVIFNVHAHPSVKNDKFGEYLLQQLTSPVRWHQSILYTTQQLNVNHYLEFGPSTPLTAMLRTTTGRLSHQTLIDPTEHPVDALQKHRQPHPSILPVILPTPKFILDDGTSLGDKDVNEILGGMQAIWQQLQLSGASSPDELRALMKQQVSA